MSAPRDPSVARRELFLVSFLILFFELAAIRWFGATVVFLTFFTNIVLLATFLGMSVGLLSARGARDFMPAVLPLALVAFAAAVAVNLLYSQWAGAITVNVGAQQSNARLVYFGADYRPADPTRWVVPMWAVAGTFFTLIALVFVGLGQVMGRAFDALPDRVAAYTIDIAGSLSGIAAFFAMSWFELPPTAWFVPIIALLLYFTGWRRPLQLAAAAAAYALVAFGAHWLPLSGEPSWSPYYKVTFSLDTLSISTNEIAHQNMVPVSQLAPAYLLPYFLFRDAGAPPFREVMIIGAGSGNDVSAALRAGARRVDAVEIDPRIHSLGRQAHPERPYSDPRVSVRLDDGRSFVRGTERKYDLAVYALVDSLVLHSGYSSVRLENFLFTRDAFEDVKRVLKDDGVFAMYNYYRQGWLVHKLATMARDVFGVEPLVLSLPHRDRIGPDDGHDPGFTFILVSKDPQRLAALRERFDRGERFWLHGRPSANVPINGYATHAPHGEGWSSIGATRVALGNADPLPSDDWPQLYLRGREIPWAPIGQGLLTVALLSAAILFAFAPRRRVRMNWQMFFLGAGFMLLETKGVVHMALLFGSTWVVNSVVFFAILLMVLAANLYVVKVRPQKLALFYVLLIAALLVNALVPMNVFLSLPIVERTVLSCAVVFIPVLFAGVIFATRFRDSREPDVDFGSNVAGIILGGLSESLSLVLGFSHLLLVAVAFYLLSALLRPRASVQ
jgi:SAM-dependent methyltransferase